MAPIQSLLHFQPAENIQTSKQHNHNTSQTAHNMQMSSPHTTQEMRVYLQKLDKCDPDRARRIREAMERYPEKYNMSCTRKTNSRKAQRGKRIKKTRRLRERTEAVVNIQQQLSSTKFTTKSTYEHLKCIYLTLTWPPVWGPTGAPTSQEILLPSKTLVDGNGCHFFLYENIETGKKTYRTTWGPTGKPLS